MQTLEDLCISEFQLCAVKKGIVPRSLVLGGHLAKKVKLGANAVDHDEAIADAYAGGDGARAVAIAKRVAFAKCEFRSELSSTESVGDFGENSSIQKPGDYEIGSDSAESAESVESGSSYVFTADKRPWLKESGAEKVEEGKVSCAGYCELRFYK